MDLHSFNGLAVPPDVQDSHLKSRMEVLLMPRIKTLSTTVSVAQPHPEPARVMGSVNRYNRRGKVTHVCQVTTVHAWNDTRIFQRMCRSLAMAGLEVTLVAPAEEEKSAEGIHILPTKLRGKIARLIGAPVLLYRLLRIHANMYQFHDPELLPWMTLFQLLVPSSAVIYDVHEFYPDTVIANRYFKVKCLDVIVSKIFLFLEPFLGRLLRGVIGVTGPIAHRFEGGRARIVVIRNLVDLPSVRSARVSARAHEDGAKPSDRPLLVLGGTIDDQRCMEQLIRALGLLKDRGLVIDLLCLGNPQPSGFADRLLALAGRLGLTGQITIMETKPFEEYQRHVARSALGMVLYAPGLNNSMGVPNRLYEFMAHGIPVVASDFPEVARVVKDADCGLLVDAANPGNLADAMEYLLTRPEEAVRLGINGRRAIEDRYNWESESRKLLGFYAQVLEEME